MTMPRATAPKLSESQVLRAVLGILRREGIPCQRRNTGGMYDPRGRFVRFSQPGTADVTDIVWPGGRAGAVETKGEDWRPRGKADRERLAKQIGYLNRINAAGGAALLVDHPRTLERLLPLIRAGAKVWVLESGQMEVTP